MPLKSMKLFHSSHDNVTTFTFMKRNFLKLQKTHPNEKRQEARDYLFPFANREVYKFSNLAKHNIKVWKYFEKERTLPKTFRKNGFDFDPLRYKSDYKNVGF